MTTHANDEVRIIMIHYMHFQTLNHVFVYSSHGSHHIDDINWFSKKITKFWRHLRQTVSKYAALIVPIPLFYESGPTTLQA